MIVLSAGLPKSGTGWYYNLTNDLMVAAGLDDARTIRDKYHLDGILDGWNCRLAKQDYLSIARIIIPHFKGHSFAIKTHAKPRQWLTLARRIIKPTYIFRDPRDVALSAFDNGKEMREKGVQHQFANLLTVEDAIHLTQTWLRLWRAWSRYEHTLFVRYEDLLTHPQNEMQRLVQYLGLEIEDETLHQIIKKYQGNGNSINFPGLHYNKGQSGRYADGMTPEQLDYAMQLFDPWLEKMGYS